jgi:lipopolysaccharide/colanic/teichoic acid biosynthesis glycosyltransferase
MSAVRSYPTKNFSLLERCARRALDLIAGSVLLCLSAPIWLLAALAVRIETRGNPFFVQTRIGLGGKPFRIVKLRGMYIDARTRFPELYDYTRFGGGLDFHFHYEEDPRITRVGSFIRKTSVDELPNFINVVLGDMSLVGPRPEVPDVLELYGKHLASYVSVKPGITCLSKVTGRDTLTKRETVELDLTYIRDASLRMDGMILWKTFRNVLLRQDVFHRTAPDAAAAKEPYEEIPD